MRTVGGIMVITAVIAGALSFGEAWGADPTTGGGVFQFELADGIVITGRIDAKVIAIRISTGNVLKIPVAALKELTVGLNDRHGLVKRVDALINALGSAKTRQKALRDLIALGPAVEPIVKRHAAHDVTACRLAVGQMLWAYKRWASDYPDTPESMTRPLKLRSKVRTGMNTFFGTLAAGEFKIASPYGRFTVKLDDINRIRPGFQTASGNLARWAVELRDKTHLRGMVINKSLRIETRYGTMVVPLAQIQKATFTANGKSICLQSCGSDRIVGAIEPKTTISLKTNKGRLDLPEGKIAVAVCGPLVFGHSTGVCSVAFSPDGKRLVSGCHEEAIRLWDTATGKELLRLKGKPGVSNIVAFSPDSKRLVSACAGGTIKLWDTAGGGELFTLKAHSGSVHAVAFSPDGKRLASGSSDKTVKLWDAETGKNLLTIKGHPNMVLSVAFSPDGKRLASGGFATPIKLWDTVTGKELLAFEGDSKNTYCVAFSPDGKRLVSGNLDRTVGLWDTVTGKKLFALKGHSYAVLSVAFSPDGKWLASGGNYNNSYSLQHYDGAVRVWDATTGKELFTLKGHLASVKTVAFSPDGKCLASGSDTIKLWDALDGTEAPK